MGRIERSVEVGGRVIAHENGVIESSHDHLKSAVNDALLMRGTGDLADLAAYRTPDEATAVRCNKEASDPLPLS